MDRAESTLFISFMALLIIALLFLLFITFSFQNTTRPLCIFPAEVDCVGYKTSNETQNTLQLQLINNMHENFNVTFAEITDSRCSYGIITQLNGTSYWPADSILYLNFHCKEIHDEEGYLNVNIELLPEIEPISLRFTGKVRFR